MIEAEDVTFLYRRALVGRSIRALDGFSIKVEPGDIFGLLGPNGAGKSTAMYCLLGLLKPRSGRVTVNGAAPEPGEAYLEKVAYVPEEPHYHLYLSVEEALRYYAGLYRAPVPRARIDAALERVGLAGFRGLRLAHCSKGMKQKLGIAACLLIEPELVFLDEPTRGLDPVIVKEFRDILLEMSRAGATIFINSHVLSEVEMVCNRVAIMNRGRVVVQDEMKNLLKVDQDRYEVALPPFAPLPAYLQVERSTDEEVSGLVPADRIEEFFAAARAGGVRVARCALKRLTLEEAFMSVVNEEAPR